jgi:UDP-glucose 4-epimerase
MKTLVTGGCGFIGSHLAEQLLDQGHEVVILDNLSCGRMANIASFENNPKVSIFVADIADREQIAPAFVGIDWVFHLAGIADIVPSIERPDAYFQNNVIGTLNVLQCARDAEVKRLVYAASSSSYGIPSQYPTPETSPIQPQYPYALTKYMGEELVLHWSYVYRFPALSLRLFNVYGPRSRTTGAYGAVFGVFLAQKLHGRPYTVVGDGQQTRDFTYVTDVASAFINAAQSKASGEAINVGSGNHYSVNYLVSLLGGEKVHIPKRPGEPDCTFADTEKIIRLLNWAPQVSFEQGVHNMLGVIENWRDAPVWDAASIDLATTAWFKYLGNKS